MKAIITKAPNRAEDLHIAEVDAPTCGSQDDVLVRVKAFGLNRMDTMERVGAFPAPLGAIMGVEMSGIVEESSASWKKGDEVFGLLFGGGYGELVVAKTQLLVRKPSSLAWEEAASIPLVGGLKAGQTILIHAAASGVGTAAIQIAQLLGAGKIICTAGTDEKVTFLQNELNVDHSFNYRKCDWLEGVLKATNGRGADLVLDFVGTNYWEKNLKAVSVDGSTLRTRSLEYQRDLVEEFRTDLLPKLEDKSMKVVIHKAFRSTDIVAATKEMEAGRNIGKIVLVWE
ncbi:quinone oxidoreductase [Meredithblackwellia eburnea MCA 4105]